MFNVDGCARSQNLIVLHYTTIHIRCNMEFYVVKDIRPDFLASPFTLSLITGFYYLRMVLCEDKVGKNRKSKC